MCYWEYGIKYFNNETNVTETSYGILATENPKLAEAAEALDRHYGDELLEVIKLYYVNDFPCYCFNGEDTSYTVDLEGEGVV